jgi:hypothetical protein
VSPGNREGVPELVISEDVLAVPEKVMAFEKVALVVEEVRSRRGGGGGEGLYQWWEGLQMVRLHVQYLKAGRGVDQGSGISERFRMDSVLMASAKSISHPLL